MCSAISENIAYRWFCFLTIDDPVFDHSSISHFIDRIGRDGFAAIFDGLNDQLLRLGMLSPEMYVDASLVKANVSGYDLALSGMSVAEFKERAIEENGLFILTETTVDDDGIEHDEVRYFQSPEDRMPLNPVDTDARWKTTRAVKASGLQYQENVIVDLGGFILSRGATHASERESKAVAGLLEGLPLQPVSLAGDTGYSDGRCAICWRNATSPRTFPSIPRQETSVVTSGDSTYHGDHLVCPQADPAAGCVPQTAAVLPLRGASEGLPGLPHQGQLPAAGAKTAVLRGNHISPAVCEGPGAKPNRGRPAGEQSAQDHRRRNFSPP